MKSNNGYWLVLYPFIFIFSKEKNVLFYNSQTGNLFPSLENHTTISLQKYTTFNARLILIFHY